MNTISLHFYIQIKAEQTFTSMEDNLVLLSSESFPSTITAENYLSVEMFAWKRPHKTLRWLPVELWDSLCKHVSSCTLNETYTNHLIKIFYTFPTLKYIKSIRMRPKKTEVSKPAM